MVNKMKHGLKLWLFAALFALTGCGIQEVPLFLEMAIANEVPHAHGLINRSSFGNGVRKSMQ